MHSTATKISLTARYEVENRSKRNLGREVNQMVARDGIEPPTRGFSVLCSTNWAIWPTRAIILISKPMSTLLRNFFSFFYRPKCHAHERTVSRQRQQLCFIRYSSGFSRASCPSPAFSMLGPVHSACPIPPEWRRLFISRCSPPYPASPNLSVPSSSFSVIKRDNFKKGPLNLLLKLLS